MATKYDLETRNQLLRWYHQTQSPTSVQRLFQRTYATFQIPSRKYIRQLVEKFNETGSILDRTRSGRPKTHSTPLVKNQVQGAFQRSPTKSIRKASSQLQIPQTTIFRCLHNTLDLHPYKAKFIEKLSPADTATRRTFAQNFLTLLHNDPSLLRSLLFTDESNFYVEAPLNNQNCRHWSSENPHFTVDKSLHSPHVCVWMGICYQGVLGPYFFPATVTGDSYYEMLTHFLFPALRSRRITFKSLTFQQDGATPHCSMRVLSLLSSKFHERVLSRRTNQPWPPRSPDLTPCDYYLWGRLKEQVYRVPLHSLEELQERISECANQLDLAEIQSALDNFEMRLSLLKKHRGGSIEPFL